MTIETISRPRCATFGMRVVILLAVCVGAVAGCQTVDRPIGPDEVFFPQPPPRVGRSVLMTAIGRGTLVMEHRCLWLDTVGARRLVIWPPSYRLVARSGRLTVVDASGDAFASVGDEIQLGGGSLTAGGRRHRHQRMGRVRHRRAHPASLPTRQLLGCRGSRRVTFRDAGHGFTFSGPTEPELTADATLGDTFQ